MWGWIPASAGITEGVGEVVAALDGDLGGVEAHQDYVEVVFEIVGEFMGFGLLCVVMAFSAVRSVLSHDWDC